MKKRFTFNIYDILIALLLGVLISYLYFNKDDLKLVITIGEPTEYVTTYISEEISSPQETKDITIEFVENEPTITTKREVIETFTYITNEDSTNEIIEDIKEEPIIEEIIETPTIKEEPIEEIYTDPIPGYCLTDIQGKVLAANNKEKYNKEVNELFEIINNYRIENGLYPLEYNDLATNMAMHRAVENAWVSCFTTAIIDGDMRHVRPNGKLAYTITNVYNVNWVYGENMGRYQRTPQEIFEGWRTSEGHNRQMLSNEAKSLGIGIAQDKDGYFYWVTSFIY